MESWPLNNNARVCHPQGLFTEIILRNNIPRMVTLGVALQIASKPLKRVQLFSLATLSLSPDRIS